MRRTDFRQLERGVGAVTMKINGVYKPLLTFRGQVSNTAVRSAGTAQLEVSDRPAALTEGVISPEMGRPPGKSPGGRPTGPDPDASRKSL